MLLQDGAVVLAGPGLDGSTGDMATGQPGARVGPKRDLRLLDVGGRIPSPGLDLNAAR